MTWKRKWGTRRDVFATQGAETETYNVFLKLLWALHKSRTLMNLLYEINYFCKCSIAYLRNVDSSIESTLCSEYGIWFKMKADDLFLNVISNVIWIKPKTACRTRKWKFYITFKNRKSPLLPPPFIPTPWMLYLTYNLRFLMKTIFGCCHIHWTDPQMGWQDQHRSIIRRLPMCTSSFLFFATNVTSEKIRYQLMRPVREGT